MRKYATSWIIKILLFAIVVVFVFWGVGSYEAHKETKAATVNGDLITMEQYRFALRNMIEQYRNMYGGRFSDDMIETLGLKAQALDELINQVLLLQEAQRLKLKVSDSELAEIIKTNPAFQENGVFSWERYNLVLKHSGYKPEIFEARQREDLLRRKVQYFIMSNVKVSDQEAWEWFMWDRVQVKVEHAAFYPDLYVTIEAELEEIEEYFANNRESYKTEPRRKAQYLIFSPEFFQEGITVTEDEIMSYYADNLSDYQLPKTVEARHILIKNEPESSPEKIEEARQQANEIYQQAIEGQDFAQLAETHSACPSKEQGGFLGAFGQEDMVSEFSDKAFSMMPGEISEPVLTQFGWHIIKVETVNEASLSSLEDASESIKNILAVQRAKTNASEAAYAIYDNYYQGDNLADIAQAKGLEIQTTDFFTRRPGPANMKNAQRFAARAFRLELMSLSEVMEIDNDFYLIQVIEEAPAELAELKDVELKVKDDLLREKRDQQAKADAEALLAAIKSAEPENRQEVLEQHQISLEVTEPFGRIGQFPLVERNEPELLRVSFTLSPDQPYPDEVVKSSKGYHILGLVEYIEPKREEFEIEQESVKETLLQNKTFKMYQEWLNGLKQRSDIQYIAKDLF